MDSGILLLDCPDRRGIVAAIAQFLYDHGGNILHADQHQDNLVGNFFMRVEWSLAGFDLEEPTFREQFDLIAQKFQMHWHLAWPARRPRIAIFVSRYQHCLVDLLYRNQIGELAGEVALIVSNHTDARPRAAFYGIPFYDFPMTAENKLEVEKCEIALLAQNNVDLIVLARYMQVLSPQFVARYPRRIINVHHSFLPAFAGAKPYHAAFERGVKLIGATSHYVTEELDEGPIIEQDVTRISHRDQAQDLVQKGRDLERVVLSRAVHWHLAHRILVYGNKTVIFD
ncbi:MAG TPA: formyltetrahydrofolate deformylase [Candidatus Dormibacteraeota bacterium]|nr:formyltetrahydrofolate deformylase [Candidatus Dormibacteraeota bacterium]